MSLLVHRRLQIRAYLFDMSFIPIGIITKYLNNQRIPCPNLTLTKLFFQPNPGVKLQSLEEKSLEQKLVIYLSA